MLKLSVWYITDIFLTDAIPDIFFNTEIQDAIFLQFTILTRGDNIFLQNYCNIITLHICNWKTWQEYMVIVPFLYFCLSSGIRAISQSYNNYVKLAKIIWGKVSAMYSLYIYHFSPLFFQVFALFLRWWRFLPFFIKRPVFWGNHFFRRSARVLAREHFIDKATLWFVDFFNYRNFFFFDINVQENFTYDMTIFRRW